LLWITPLRALAKDVQRNIQEVLEGLGFPWKTGLRTGDSDPAERRSQKKQMPEILIITPESLHLLFTQKDFEKWFDGLDWVVVDEWHELLGSKRGVQTELALALLRRFKPELRVWGMSASIGNKQEALEALCGETYSSQQSALIVSGMKKQIDVISVLPDKVDRMPWAGHVGLHLLDKVIDAIHQYRSILIFTNTRSQTEIWYRAIAERYPELAGLVALHHGSLDKEVRDWVEENIHLGKLKIVICTSSLDLGVDFRPVETVVQVGSPKSLARFIQRAGRSGHRPGEISRIFFVPTHALELTEAASLRIGIETGFTEDRKPLCNSYDTLMQFLVTLALGNGFREAELFDCVKSTHAYKYLTRDEWEEILGLITTGGRSLEAYDDFKKVEPDGGIFRVKSRRVAMRHRMNIGTIVADTAIKIQFQSGKYLGTVEEHFIARLNPGDAFVFAGMSLQFLRLQDLTAVVRKAPPGKGTVPRWSGGRMPLSSTLSAFIRDRFSATFEDAPPEMEALRPILELQAEISTLPKSNQLLIEKWKSREGHHVFIFPFEGRLVHEGMASLMAWRISRRMAVSFSIAMNDYGFELLSNKEIPGDILADKALLFSTDRLTEDISKSLNANELAKRKFREIAVISGLIFTGYPGQAIKTKHLQSSASLLFEVMSTYDPGNILIRQAYNEALESQLEESRIRETLKTINDKEIIIKQTERPSPFAFPIMVDRLREQFSSESLEERIQQMLKSYATAHGN
jgi:ATP-dependent Lhr-like helicase